MLRSFLHSVRESIDAVRERDPAARSEMEILLCYPGLHALIMHRIQHWLWKRRFYLAARLISQYTRFWTGIEIHPGAIIGQRCFIDHGMGVVIGETAVIGDNVTLFQGVTLGGTGKETGKRHPTLCDNVFVGAGANILGNITVGENSRVGAGSVVLRDVPDNATVVGVPGHLVFRDGERVVITDPKEVNDPLSEIMSTLIRQVKTLRTEVSHMRGTDCTVDELDYCQKDVYPVQTGLTVGTDKPEAERS